MERQARIYWPRSAGFALECLNAGTFRWLHARAQNHSVLMTFRSTWMALKNTRSGLSNPKLAYRSGQQSTGIQLVRTQKTLEYRTQRGLASTPRHGNHD